MKRATAEAMVGLFVLAGVVAFGYLAIRLGKLEVGGRGYPVRAVFGSVEGLAEGASVEIAGVEVGRVRRMRLESYRALVVMSIDPKVRLQDDAIASVRTKGLVGEKFIAITPGASERIVAPGGTLHDTEDAVNVEQLVANYIHGRL
jgi:phospholipid/cholesterol/gamma-HCH transport system substrate-binding protein